jgi:hypothetical protein
MARKPPHGFVEKPTVITKPEEVIVDRYGVQFGDSLIKYDDVVSVLYNKLFDDTAIVVLNVRSSANSPYSGLPQHKLLEFDVKKEAMAPLTDFIGKIRDLKVPMSETSYSPEVFSRVFAA